MIRWCVLKFILQTFNICTKFMIFNWTVKRSQKSIKNIHTIGTTIYFLTLDLHLFSFLWQERPWQEVTLEAWICRTHAVPCTTWRCTGYGCPDSNCTPGRHCHQPGHTEVFADRSWRGHPILLNKTLVLCNRSIVNPWMFWYIPLIVRRKMIDIEKSRELIFLSSSDHTHLYLSFFFNLKQEMVELHKIHFVESSFLNLPKDICMNLK